LADPGAILKAEVFTVPHVTLPIFTGKMSLTAIASIAIMAIATIPESTAHLYQIGLYVDHLADELKKPKYGLSQYIGFNLVLDGIGDMINGFLGGAAGTNYGENNSLMVITRNYSGVSLLAAAIIAILMSQRKLAPGAVHPDGSERRFQFTCSGDWHAGYCPDDVRKSQSVRPKTACNGCQHFDHRRWRAHRL
jgi:hypothetical protein